MLLTLCEENLAVTCGFLSQRVSNVEICCFILLAWRRYRTISWVDLRCYDTQVTSLWCIIKKFTVDFFPFSLTCCLVTWFCITLIVLIIVCGSQVYAQKRKKFSTLLKVRIFQAADAQAPCVARSSAAIVLTRLDKQVLGGISKTLTS